MDIVQIEDHGLADKIKSGGIQVDKARLAVLKAELEAQIKEIEGIYTRI